MEHLQHKAIWFPSRVRIGGRRLGPVTLGQLRLLECVNSPFLYSGPIELADIALALLILSRPWRFVRRLLPHPRFVFLLSPRLRASACTMIAATLDAYIADELWTPDMFQTEGSFGSSFPAASGRATRLARVVAGEGPAVSPFPRRSVWDFTCREASYACMLAAEARGTEFVTREEMTDVQ
jgi:hypothetical protein